MGTRNLNVSRFEVTGVYTNPDARVDIVLVHGLNGDPKNTWTAKNGTFWPADLLPETLKAHPANVLVYGYNADVFSRGNDRSASANFIFQHAQTLISHLTAYRKSEGTEANPIIWIAHSLGGILVKRTLLYSNDLSATHNQPFRAIYVCTYGIIFLGTPHTGSDAATWARILQAMSDAVLPKKLFESESVLLKTLKTNSERLQEINSHFLDIYQRFKIHMVHENHTTDLKATKALIVDADSASPQLPGVTYYGIEATHSGLCKFAGTNAPGYRTVTTAIREWVEEAPPVIEVRWKIEAEDRDARTRRAIDETRFMSLSQAGDAARSDEADNETRPFLQQSPTDEEPDTDAVPDNIMDPSSASPYRASGHVQISEASTRPDPLFFHPEQFRPNSYFMGRKRELEELHAKLTDKMKRAEGTSAVLIQGLPGGGKTHLARQYVFDHRADYPGGIFWIRAKSITEMEQFYWKIAKNAALRDLAQRTLEEALAGEAAAQQDLCEPRNIVSIVRRWFNSFDQWLLVFDGIRFDMDGIKKFIPDNKNTSLIYTSMQHSATGDFEFDNPQLMELRMLSAQDAQELLLVEMEKKKPWTQDDHARALELVQLMGRLPVMIHAAALHLKATREPLSKYLRTYRTRPMAGALPAYRAIWSELKSRAANPALNFMSILAFYDTWIPVGLVVLGLGALDNRTQVMTKDVSRRVKSLNNSLKVLIAFALIERTESDSLSSTSSQNSSKRSFDVGQESVDVLRIHSVVQAFFVEKLAEEKEHNFWLERSARVFCRSFDEADMRINEDPQLGLPDDYRRFTTHGRKLLEHLTRAEKKDGSLTVVRIEVEKALQRSSEAINRLSKAAQEHIVTGSALVKDPNVGAISLLSVFERANSLSESDSGSPPSQLSTTASGEASRRGTGFDELDGVAQFRESTPENDLWVLDGAYDASIRSQSPTKLVSLDILAGPNPYHWHVPYPLHTNIMPAPPPDDGDDLTEVLTPRASAGFTARPASAGVQNGRRPLASEHRTVRKIEDRKYHDRAGAWRDKTVSDPRISVSREMARGSVFVNYVSPAGGVISHGWPQITAESEAELTLNKIKAVAPPPLPLVQAVQPSMGPVTVPEAAVVDGLASDEARNQNKGRAKSTGSLGLRPLLSLDGQSEMNIPAQPAPKDGSLSSSFLKRLSRSPPSAWTAATFRRLKENFLPGRPGTSSSEPRPETANVMLSPQEPQHPLSSSIDSLLSAQPTPMFIGSRTARSSPSQGYGPFQPPARHVLVSEDVHAGYQGDGSLGASLPPTMRQWETNAYHPSHRHIDSSDLSFGLSVEDPMAASFPLVAPPGRPIPSPWRAAGPPTSLPTGQPLLCAPYADGYTSQPMTRNPSAQSQQNGGTSSAIFPAPGDNYTHVRVHGDRPYSQSFPVAGHLVPIGIPVIQRRGPPSLIETEPSPQTGGAFSDVNTSYRLWEERHVQGHAQMRAGSGNTPSGLMSVPPYPSSRGRVAAGGVAMSRSPSNSNSNSGSGSGSGSRSRSRPGAVRRDVRSQSQTPPSSQPRSSVVSLASVYQPPSSIAADAAGLTSEPMTRSGSGGIQLPDGRIIPFGQSPPIQQGLNTVHDDVEPDLDARTEAVIGLGVSEGV